MNSVLFDALSEVLDAAKISGGGLCSGERRQSLLAEILYSRVQMQAKNDTTKDVVTQYADVVVINTRQEGGGLILCDDWGSLAGLDRRSAQILSNQPLLGDILDLYHLARRVATGKIGLRGTMKRAEYNYGVAEQYLWSDIATILRSEGQLILKDSNIGYECRPYAMRELLSMLCKSGAYVSVPASPCWSAVQLDRFNSRRYLCDDVDRSDCRSDRRGKVVTYTGVVRADGLLVKGGLLEVVPTIRGRGEYHRVTTDKNHVHHILPIRLTKVRGITHGVKGKKRLETLHGAVAGRRKLELFYCGVSISKAVEDLSETRKNLEWANKEPETRTYSASGRRLDMTAKGRVRPRGALLGTRIL